MSFAPTLLAIRPPTPSKVATIMKPKALYFHVRVRSEVSLAIVGSSGLDVNCDTTASRQKTTIYSCSSYSNYQRFKNIIHCTCISVIYNNHSPKWRWLVLDIYRGREAAR